MGNIQQSSGGRRRFRPSVDRSKLRKKTESAFNPARPGSKFRLRLRRPEATTEAQTTVTEEPVTVISVSAVTSRSETEAREPLQLVHLPQAFQPRRGVSKPLN